MATDKETVEGMVKGFGGAKDGSWFTANGTPDFQFIRPSGNPLTLAEYPAFVGGDVKITDIEMVDLHKLEVCPAGSMAFACVTQYAKFTSSARAVSFFRRAARSSSSTRPPEAAPTPRALREGDRDDDGPARAPSVRGAPRTGTRARPTRTSSW